METLFDPSTLFYAAVASMATHEMDAIRHHEWRLLPVLRRLGDDDGRLWFTLLHAPLYIAIFTFINHPPFQIGFDIFAIIHVGLHWLLRNHSQYTFSGWLSNSLIVGSGACGALHLLTHLYSNGTVY